MRCMKTPLHLRFRGFEPSESLTQIAVEQVQRLEAFAGEFMACRVEAAEKSGADVILMNSHKRSGFKALLMGSETREVMADSRLPVLVL